MTVEPGQKQRPLWIVGEAGSCHEGSLDAALHLIALAQRVGCDAVKFQYWSSPARMRARRHVTAPEAYERGSIFPEWWSSLRAATRNIELGCTVYLPEDVEEVGEWVDVLKVASFEATDDELVDKCRQVTEQRMLRLVISTGMQSGYEYTQRWRPNMTYLHCVSAYPCPISQAHLGAIGAYGGGYSDHTRNAAMGAWAVAAGAHNLEVHFRLDQTSSACPDYVVALSPSEFELYVSAARIAYLAVGEVVKVPQEAEHANMAHRVV